MKDVFRAYKKQQNKQHILIIFSAFVFALGIYTFLGQNSYGKQIKASSLEAVGVDPHDEIYDIELVYNSGAISLSNTQEMLQVREISLALMYNPQAFSLEIAQWFSGSLIEIQNGYSNLLLEFDPSKDIYADSVLTQLQIHPISESGALDEAQYLNSLEAKFSDTSGETYLLRSPRIVF